MAAPQPTSSHPKPQTRALFLSNLAIPKNHPIFHHHHQPVHPNSTFIFTSAIHQKPEINSFIEAQLTMAAQTHGLQLTQITNPRRTHFTVPVHRTKAPSWTATINHDAAVRSSQAAPASLEFRASTTGRAHPPSIQRRRDLATAQPATSQSLIHHDATTLLSSSANSLLLLLTIPAGSTR
ncbi:hypothetical protein M0R45_013882 [Rubus argutus]|uniref:Uncharacterized protein n=1 Tax=Rubus argutus TaxID=59490 RepID=A0AAW1XML2_RUBAR